MKNKKYAILIMAFALVLCCGMLAGCGQNMTQAGATTGSEVSEAPNTELAGQEKSGVLLLKVNPEIAVSYDEAGLVTDIAGRNTEGTAIVENYRDYVGKNCRTVISELVAAIGDAGYFVESADSERRTITIELEAGSGMPNDTFLDDIVTGVETKVAEKNWSGTVQLDNAAGNANSTAQTPVGNANSTAQTPATGTGTTDIGADEAKNIALKHAGVAASDVTFARTEKDHDDGRWVYEVEFYSQDKEYDYDIDASTGDILSYDYDAEYYTKPAADVGGSMNYIGIEKAKTIALNHAGFSASDVSFSKAKFEDDDGRKEYEVQFYYNGIEYEYTIDASSGNIIEFESERDD